MESDKSEFNFNLSVTKDSPFMLGILSPSSVVFASVIDFKILKKIKATKESFLNGNFRKKDGKIFTTSSRNGDISLFYLSSMKILRNFICSGKVIYSTSFSDNGLNLISGGEDGRVRLWDISEQKYLQEFRSGVDTVRNVSFLPDHNWIIGSSSYDGKIRLFDLRCKKKITNYKFGSPIESFVFFPDQKVVTAIGENSIEFWDMRTNSTLFKKKETSLILNLSSPNKKSVMYTTLGRTVKYVRTSDFRFFHIGQFKKRLSVVEFLNNGFLVSFTSGKVLIKDKKCIGSDFLKTNHSEKHQEITRNLRKNIKFFGDKFLPPLKIFQQKTSNCGVGLTFKNFKKKIAYNPILENRLFYDSVIVKNEKNSTQHYSNKKKKDLKIFKCYRSLKIKGNVFFDFEYHKKLLQFPSFNYYSKPNLDILREIGISFSQVFNLKFFNNHSTIINKKCTIPGISNKLLNHIVFLFKKTAGKHLLILN